MSESLVTESPTVATEQPSVSVASSSSSVNGPSPQKRHWTSNLGLLILLILLVITILALTALLVAYTQTIKNAVTVPANVHLGIWKIFNENFACTHLQANCQSPNASSPYGRFLWPFLGDRILPLSNEGSVQALPHVIGAHPMAYTDAILIYGTIPFNRVYWAITAYLYSIPSTSPAAQNGRLTIAACVANSISAANTFGQSDSDTLALVVSPNPNMFAIVQKQFYSQFPASAFGSIQWKSIWIPSEMYEADFDYCIFTRIVQTPQNDIIPSWNALWYTAPAVPNPTLPVAASWIPRNVDPSELLMYFCTNDSGQYDPSVPCPIASTQMTDFSSNLSLWYNFVQNVVSSDTDLKNVTTSYLGKTLPAFSWVDGMCPGGIGSSNCGLYCGCQALQFQFSAIFDNTDTIYYVVYDTSNNSTAASHVIQVPQGNDVIVIAVDHVQTGAVIAYCNLTFTDYLTGASFLSVITGLRSDPHAVIQKPPSTVPYQKILVTIPDEYFVDGFCNLQLIERAYVSPSGIGPSFVSILPCQAFVVLSNSVSGTQQYTTSILGTPGNYPYSL
jgi:hypothetical protein